jgi:hypothetical protein
MRPAPRPERRQQVDLLGAVLVAVGTFLLVFGLSEGTQYGWIEPLRSLTVLGHEVWPGSRPVSAMPMVFLLAIACLVGFYRWERARERSARDPLFEFGMLRHLSFRYGLITTAVLAMGQLGFLFVIPVFLQDGRRLSALDSGLWLVPSGVCIIVGAQLAGRLTRRFDTTHIVRAGLIIQSVGLLALALTMSTGLTFAEALPSFVLFGLGLGFASSQLTNVVLLEAPPENAGAASGANTTVRQIGSALGIAIIGTLLSAQTTSSAIRRVGDSDLAAPLRAVVDGRLRAAGVGFRPPDGASTHDAEALRRILESAVADGARPALLFAAFVISVGAGLSFLIPRLGHLTGGPAAGSFETIDPVEALDGLEAIDRR